MSKEKYLLQKKTSEVYYLTPALVSRVMGVRGISASGIFATKDKSYNVCYKVAVQSLNTGAVLTLYDSIRIINAGTMKYLIVGVRADNFNDAYATLAQKEQELATIVSVPVMRENCDNRLADIKSFIGDGAASEALPFKRYVKKVPMSADMFAKDVFTFDKKQYTCNSKFYSILTVQNFSWNSTPEFIQNIKNLPADIMFSMDCVNIPEDVIKKRNEFLNLGVKKIVSKRRTAQSEEETYEDMCYVSFTLRVKSADESELQSTIQTIQTIAAAYDVVIAPVYATQQDGIITMSPAGARLVETLHSMPQAQVAAYASTILS